MRRKDTGDSAIHSIRVSIRFERHGKLLPTQIYIYIYVYLMHTCSRNELSPLFAVAIWLTSLRLTLIRVNLFFFGRFVIV